MTFSLPNSFFLQFICSHSKHKKHSQKARTFGRSAHLAVVVVVALEAGAFASHNSLPLPFTLATISRTFFYFFHKPPSLLVPFLRLGNRFVSTFFSFFFWGIQFAHGLLGWLRDIDFRDTSVSRFLRVQCKFRFFLSKFTKLWMH